MLLYKIVVGRALVDFIIRCATAHASPLIVFSQTFVPRWRQVVGHVNVYSLSLEYDGGGVGRVLFSDLIVTLDCAPEHLSFVL